MSDNTVTIEELPLAVSLDGTEQVPIAVPDGSGGYTTERTTTGAVAAVGVNAEFVLVSANPLLPNSRILAGASGQVTVNDGGAAQNVTVGLAASGVDAGTFGDGTHVPQVTVDSTGRLTSASSVAITHQGTVTSVGLTAPTEISVSGSPVTSSGTLGLTWAGQQQNAIFAAPASGGAGTPGFRALVAADFPVSGVTAGTYGDGTHVGQFTVDATGRLTSASQVALSHQGDVTSVGLSLPADFTVSGSPVTSSGTLTGTWATSPTGTGAIVRANSPTLVTPALGTPTAIDLTNATGLPLAALPKGTAGYGLMGNGASAPSFQGFTYPATGAVARTWQAKAQEIASVLDFGAVGNCTGVGLGTDDTAAIQLAVNWLTGASYRQLIFPAGYRWRIAGQITVDFGGNLFNKFIMLSPCTPDAVAGVSFTFLNTAFTEFKLEQFQGGVDADYTQPDPTGGQTTFYFRGTRDCTVSLDAYWILGRALRCTLENVSDAYKTSNFIFTRLTIEEQIGHPQTGQLGYFDASSAFGTFVEVNENNVKYGSVFTNNTANTTLQDVNIGVWEGGLTLSSPTLFKNIVSLFAHSFALGGQTVPNAIKFDNVSGSHIDQILGLASDYGVVFENCGGSVSSPTGQFSIDTINTSNCETAGISLTSCVGMQIGCHISYEDATAEALSNCQECDIGHKVSKSSKTGVTIDSSCDDITFRGSMYSCAVSGSAYHGFRIDGTGRILFDGYKNTGSTADALYYIISASNNVRLNGGSVFVSGSTAVFGGNKATSIIAVSGYNVRAFGQATINSGSSSITVTHGLSDTPTEMLVTPRTAGSPVAAANSATSTTFNIVLGSAAAATYSFSWEAVAPGGTLS